jgi:hypothetical protein
MNASQSELVVSEPQENRHGGWQMMRTSLASVPLHKKKNLKLSNFRKKKKYQAHPVNVEDKNYF